jgi:hypothetical protein
MSGFMLDYDRCDGTGKVADSIAAGGRVAKTGKTGTVMPDSRRVKSGIVRDATLTSFFVW